MNTLSTSVTKHRNVFLLIFLKSLYCVLPFGTFMIACNCLFESVRNYYFDWMIVVLPTAAVCVIASLYEMFIVYQWTGLFMKSERTFTKKQMGYSVSNSNLVTN